MENNDSSDNYGEMNRKTWEIMKNELKKWWWNGDMTCIVRGIHLDYVVRIRAVIHKCVHFSGGCTSEC